MDSVTSPATAIEVGKLGGVGVLDLEGVWTRYEDPTEEFARIARTEPSSVTRLLQRMYSEPVKRELIFSRLAEIRSAGVPVAGALSPGRTQDLWKTVIDAGVDLFIIRGTTVSAEHVSASREPLNLKRFIYELEVPVSWRSCDLHRCAAPDAHGCSRSASRVRRRRSFGNSANRRHSRSHGHCGSRYCRRAPRLFGRVRWTLCPRHRRRVGFDVGRSRQGHRVWRRRRYARHRVGKSIRGSRSRVALGARGMACHASSR